MKIALLGYGRMGKAIEKVAIERGHSVVAKIDKDNKKGKLSGADVAINFSVPDAAITNIKAALKLQIPVVCGTTGWLESIDEIKQYCNKNNAAFIYSSNFSIGVNLFFKLNQVLAELMQPHRNYKAEMKEIHHSHKIDAPSGTAITLAESIINKTEIDEWSINEVKNKSTLPITIERTGEIHGTHIIAYKSSVDNIKIEHEAHSREGFALGAVITAEWIENKKGIFSMNDVLNIN
tara:strand:+ start:605 stop:1309 length:705 start_codon:yes stop_codon:yes gene_type:complete